MLTSTQSLQSHHGHGQLLGRAIAINLHLQREGVVLQHDGDRQDVSILESARANVQPDSQTRGQRGKGSVRLRPSRNSSSCEFRMNSWVVPKAASSAASSSLVRRAILMSRHTVQITVTSPVSKQSMPKSTPDMVLARPNNNGNVQPKTKKRNLASHPQLRGLKLNDVMTDKMLGVVEEHDGRHYLLLFYVGESC
jgi:hypothetical protein